MKPCNFIDPTATLGKNVSVWHFAVILANVIIEDNVSIGSHVEIGRGSHIGTGTRIGKGAFLPPNSRIGNNVFIAPGVFFCDDKHPRAGNTTYLAQPPIVNDLASIGAGSIILPGIRIGKNAVIGAGSVVTHDVPENMIVYGEPARQRLSVGDKFP